MQPWRDNAVFPTAPPTIVAWQHCLLYGASSLSSLKSMSLSASLSSIQVAVAEPLAELCLSLA
jgi:hypothetical protein